jgi:hypothetical protein
MGLYRFLRSVGFEDEDIAGGLLAEHPAMQLYEKQERLENRIRKIYGRLVRHRRVLEELRRDEQQGQTLQFPNPGKARLQRREKAYARNLQLLARLKGKLKRLQAKLV